jgi:2',3'-cyclic-nucleotide 2'-phosphodiesterase
MRFLFIGDIVGRPGVVCVKELAPTLRADEKLDLVIANAENASGGSGLLPSAYRQLREAGVDVVTMGDHIYKKQDLIPLLIDDERICKPANYPPDAPGHEYAAAIAAGGTPVGVISLLGRTFMRPVDCPFRAVDRVLSQIASKFPVVIVDMHAETTADKYLMLHHLKGRVAAVIGTHTHVQTADEQILAGTAFVADVGMTGPYDSILGRRIDRVLATTVTFVPSTFEVAEGDVRLGGVLVDVDPATGKAGQIRRIILKQTVRADGAG